MVRGRNPNITKMFSGIRMRSKKINGKITSIPILPKLQLTKNLFKQLEKSKTLTHLQKTIVETTLNKCNEKTSPEYVARLLAIIEKE